MEIVEIEAGLTHIRGGEVGAELFDDRDRQALETDELDDVELGWLGLQYLQRSHTLAVPAAEGGSVLQQLAQNANTVVFLQQIF